MIKFDFDDKVLSLSDKLHNKTTADISSPRKYVGQPTSQTNLFSIITGTLQKRNTKDIPHYIVQNKKMPYWQRLIKIINDYFIAILMAFTSIPLSLLISIGIKLTSKGPIIYKQIRLGRNKKPFTMYKFRTMYIDAEKNGCQLASTNDPRITSFGKHLRKWHLDEIPQFINIIKGDMSLVGPRPEREYYVNKITKEAPLYEILFSVKPGLTSWGRIKYGYAESVEQMIERLNYDIVYMRNPSLSNDFIIFLYTFKSILSGDGK